MKQTNNAIKFLMAQYRAIFKNANVAMVAAMVAAALAAGQAQAAANDNALDLGTDAKNPVASDSINSDIKVSGSTGGFIDELTIAKGGTLTFDGSSSANTGHILVGKNLNIQSGGRLILKGSADGQTAGWGVVGTYKGTDKNPVNQDPNFDEANSTLNVDGGTVEITKSQIQMTNVNLNNAAVTIQKNHGDNSNSDWADNAQINAMTNAAGQGGIFNVSGDKTVITMNSGSVLNAHIFNLNDGKIDLKGTSGDGTYAIVRSFGGGSVNLAGSEVTASGTGNLIVGANINISEGSTVTVNASSALTLAGPLNNKSDAASAAAGNIKVTGGLVDVKATGTLNIKGDATFADGTLANAGTVSYTLAQDATNSLTVGSKAFGELLKGKLSVSGVSSSGIETFKLVIDGDADLVTSGFLTEAGAINTNKVVLSDVDASSLTAKNVTIRAAAYSGATAIKADSLVAGKEGAFAIKSGSTVDVAKGLTVTAKESKADLTVNGTLNLDGTGGNVAANVELAQDQSSTPALNVKSGNWNMQSLKLTSGAATVSGENTKVTFAQTSTLETTANGKLNIQDNALVDASKATVDLKASSVEMTGYSSLVLDGSKLVKLSDTTGDLVTFQNGLLANSVTGDNKSKIIFTGMSSMSMEQFQELKKEATSFKGTWEGFGINGAAADKELAIGNVESGLGGNYYNNTQATVDSATNIQDSYTVGNIKVTDGANASISGGSLTLTNASANGSNGNFIVNKDGKAGGVALNDADSVLALQNKGTIGAITSATAGEGVVIIGEAYNNSKSGNVTVSGSIGAQGTSVGELDVSSNSVLTVNGDVYTKQMYTLANSKVNMPNNKLVIGTGSAKTDGSSEIFGDITAKEIKVEGSGGIIFAGGAIVDVATLTGTDEHSFIQVGEDKAGGLGATVLVDKLNLNSGTIFVDPDFNAPASKLVLGQLEGNKLNGKATVGKNAILAIGFDNEEDVKRILSQYLNDNGSFVSGSEVQNALLLNKGIELGQSDKIIIDPEATSSSSNNAAVAFGKGSALVVTDAAYTTVNGKKEGYAIKLNAAANSVDASKGGTVILSGKFNAGDKGITIFSGSNITGTVGVQSSNGLINGTIGSTGTIDTLKLEEGKIDSQMAGVSAPVRDLFKKLLGVDGDKYLTGNGVGAELLATIGTDSMTGVEADAAAHAATYAGAQQAAVASVSTMADAMFGRVGTVGVEAASIAATGSQANGGVWVTPMYKNVDADGFNAEGATYGADIDLAGVAFGADTVNGNMRFGAVFNIGSGDADGKGNGSGLKNEFDYYGFGIYSAMGFGNFSLVGDASLTVISHDVEGYSGVESFGNLNGKADTTAVTMGLTGQYAFSTPMVDVVPHAGVRFTRLDTESYDLNSAKGVVGTTDFDVQNVFSVPVGVSLSKSLNAGGWLLAPSADLTITFNGGDTEAKSNTKFTGITENVALNTEVLDEVTYGLTLGLGAQYGAFGTSFGINYTGSENTDSFGVNAQARYMF